MFVAFYDQYTKFDALVLTLLVSPPPKPAPEVLPKLLVLLSRVIESSFPLLGGSFSEYRRESMSVGKFALRPLLVNPLSSSSSYLIFLRLKQ